MEKTKRSIANDKPSKFVWYMIIISFGFWAVARCSTISQDLRDFSCIIGALLLTSCCCYISQENKRLSSVLVFVMVYPDCLFTWLLRFL